ncbi:MAG: hypothetical protein K6E70_13790 [Butyrivibrio sp.]|nr:hypothetical protein [Butyrivibrio sp.]
MEKVEQLERELSELKLKVEGLEADLRKAESRITEISPVQTEPRVNEPEITPAQSVSAAADETASYSKDENTNTYGNAAAPYTYGNIAASNTYGNSTAAYTYGNSQAPNTYGKNATSNTYGNVTGPNTYGNYAPQYGQQQRPASNIGTESWIGKILMGALASLLVFIALITFAKLLLPFLTDGIKIALMFIASTALTGTGFLLGKKKPSNTFFKALLGCGCACIYLSILVTGIHFKAINSIVMYVLLAIWAIFMIFLKESKNDWLFFSIGNLGYFVSIMFTAGLKDKALVLPMLIYVVIISAVYQIMYWKNQRQREVQSVINIISLLLFQILITNAFSRTVECYIVSAVTVVWAFAGFLFFTFCDLFSYRKNHFYFAVVNSLAFFVSFMMLNSSLHLPAFIDFGVVLIPAIALEAINIYWRSNKLARSESILNAVIAGFFFLGAAIILVDNYHVIYESGILMLVYSFVIVYGLLKKDTFFKIHGWALVGICIFIGMSNNTGLFFAFVAAIIGLSSLIVEGIVFNDSVAFKLVSYICLIGAICRMGYLATDIMIFSGKEDIVRLVTYGVIAVLNLIMILTGFYRTNEKNNGRDLHAVLDAFNIILILTGAGFMGAVESNVLKAFYMVITFALACINLPIKEKGTRYRYLYAGIKLGTLLFYSLCTFKAPSPVISMGMIAFAVLCIAIGFKNTLLTKELRIFGLITTLIFIVKFIIFDISFDSSLMKALSYLISGILCFAISAIYNHFEKKAIIADSYSVKN